LTAFNSYPFFILLVFTSNSLDTGWDGTYQGKMCQEDTYIYILKWKDRKGGQYIGHGHLTLIKLNIYIV
jgi:hypothetical protein